MANINSVRTTANILQNKRVVDMAKDIALLDPKVAPFLTIMKQLKRGTRVAIGPKVEWLEDDYLGFSTQLNGAISATSTTSLTVDDGTIFRVGDIIHIPSVNENMLVTTVSGNTLTVTRGYGSTTAQAAIADNAIVLIIGNANEENAGARKAISTQELAKFNYTQIFRTPCQLSNTLLNTDVYGKKERAYQRMKALNEHKMDIARAMYFGQKKEDTTGTQVRRTMGGIMEFIKTGSNTQTFAPSGSSGAVNFTWKLFNEKVAKKAFLHGSSSKLLIAGGTTSAAMDAWAIDKCYLPVDEEIFGLHIRKMVTTYGELKVLWDPLLDMCGYSDYGFILDMDKIKYVHLQNRDTKLNVDIQENDIDGVMDEYITECSIEVKNPDAHFMFSGAYVG